MVSHGWTGVGARGVPRQYWQCCCCCCYCREVRGIKGRRWRRRRRRKVVSSVVVLWERRSLLVRSITGLLFPGMVRVVLVVVVVVVAPLRRRGLLLLPRHGEFLCLCSCDRIRMLVRTMMLNECNKTQYNTACGVRSAPCFVAVLLFLFLLWNSFRCGRKQIGMKRSRSMVVSGYRKRLCRRRLCLLYLFVVLYLFD